ncbi:MAG: RelE/StbE family addiction module toxin [Ignavibacteria bacterium]|nr:RelE/StbE family addiction module toxin [Ignavibacteria bacterium]
MIEIIWEDSFVKKFKKLKKSNPDLTDKFIEKVNLFSDNPYNAGLKTHKLSGKLSDYWAFSIDFNYRVVFRFGEDDIVYFMAIGTHDEVY